MANCDLDQLLDALWPSGSASASSVWAIFDGARDPRVFPALRNSGLDYICLYSGDLPRELKPVAPYLVELTRHGASARHLLDLAWGNSWGIFLGIDDCSNLRPHLRQFLRVRDESGRYLLFRYYDPRVFRVYLPTCNLAELKTLFGPIKRFMVEDEHPERLIEFTFDGIRLHERRLELAARATLVQTTAERMQPVGP